MVAQKVVSTVKLNADNLNFMTQEEQNEEWKRILRRAALLNDFTNSRGRWLDRDAKEEYEVLVRESRVLNVKESK